MKTTTLLLLFLFPFFLFFQESKYTRIDYDKLQRVISDPSISSYYPKLMVRYRNCDTTLSIEEYRELYFGYTFQSDYQPYWVSKQTEKLRPIYAKSNLTPADCDAIIEYASLSVEDFPFNLRELNALGYAYHLKGIDSEAVKCNYKSSRILSAILSTGDGKTCESAWQVVSIAHEYDVLNYFHLRETRQGLSLGGHCDILNVDTNTNAVDSVYFDVRRILELEMKSFGK